MHVSVSSTWSSMEWMDGRGTYYGTVLPLGREGMLVCMRACTCDGLGGAVLGGAVRCGACAVRCLCCAVLASLSESNETDESTG